MNQKMKDFGWLVLAIAVGLTIVAVVTKMIAGKQAPAEKTVQPLGAVENFEVTPTDGSMADESNDEMSMNDRSIETLEY